MYNINILHCIAHCIHNENNIELISIDKTYIAIQSYKPETPSEHERQLWVNGVDEDNCPLNGNYVIAQTKSERWSGTQRNYLSNSGFAQIYKNNLPLLRKRQLNYCAMETSWVCQLQSHADRKRCRQNRKERLLLMLTADLSLNIIKTSNLEQMPQPWGSRNWHV